MTTLKLTMMLGPRETIEVAEASMPDMPGVLWAADVIEGWDPAEVERVLLAAGDVFRQAIQERRHEQPPPPPNRPPPLEVEETRLEREEVEEVIQAAFMKSARLRHPSSEGRHEQPQPPPAPGPRAKPLPAEVRAAMLTQAVVRDTTSVARDVATLDPANFELVPGAITVQPSSPTLVRDPWGDPTPAERLTIEAGAPTLGLRTQVARTLAPEAWAAADASLRKADEVLALIEGRRAA